MAAQKGRNILLKVESSPGSGTYNTAEGSKVTSLKLGNEVVDITNKDSAGIRQLLAGAGTTSIDITISGIFQDASNYQLMRASARANTHLNYKFAFPATTNVEVYTGAFMISSFEENGDWKSEMTYTISLMSAGTVTVAAT